MIYTKIDDIPDCDKLRNEYYEPLLSKYGLGGILNGE